MDELEKYLKALSHPVRRTVIKALAEKKSLSYTELLRISGVNDSGTFAFHLRMLGNLVRKNPETGEYELTEDGWRAYRALRLLEGESSAENTGYTDSREVVIISDRLSAIIDEKLVDNLIQEGKRLYIRDILYLRIEDMPEEKLSRVLEGLEDVFMVSVPSRLRHIVEMRGRDIAIIGNGGMGLISGISKIIAESVTRSIALVPKLMGKYPVYEKQYTVPQSFTIEEEPITSISMHIDSSDIALGIGKTVLFNGKGTHSSTATARTKESEAEIILKDVRGELFIPQVRNIKARVDTSKLRGEIAYEKELKIILDTSNYDLKITGYGSLHASIDTSNGKLSLYLPRPPANHLELVFDVDTSNASIDIHLPRNTIVDVVRQGYFISSFIDGEPAQRTRISASHGEGLVRVIVNADSSNVKLNIVRDLEPV